MVLLGIVTYLALANTADADAQQPLPPWSRFEMLADRTQPCIDDPVTPGKSCDNTGEGQGAAPAERIVGPHIVCGGPEDEQYSGYLGAGPDTSYFFVLSRKRPQAPADAPLLLWLNGGPGCSSLSALVFENGPCSLMQKGGSYEQRQSDHGWTEAADVLWVEQPAGVGFSRGPLVQNEEDVASHMLVFLERFFANFQEFQGRRFFIFGESYAGHYVPAIASAFLRSGGSLDGVALGNGLVNVLPQYYTYPEMAYTGGEGGSLGHGVVNRSVYEAMLRARPACTAAFERAQHERNSNNTLQAFKACAEMTVPVVAMGLNPYDLRKRCIGKLCYPTDDQEAFFNDPEVRRVLGVAPGSSPWKPCSTRVAGPFMLSGDIATSYEGDIAAVLEAGVPFLVYHGDTDYMCHWVGGKRWAEELSWPHRAAWAVQPDEDYHAAGTRAGRVRSLGGFTFLQIFHSGHMVPRDQPAVALQMVRDFVTLSSPWRRPLDWDGVELASHDLPYHMLLGATLLAASLAASVFIQLRRRAPLSAGSEPLLA